MSTSLHSKKKEARKIEPPQINNECIEKALIQLTRAVMEVGYLIKCILVVLVFFGLAFLVKILLMYFHVPKINDEKKICVCKEKCTRPGCVRALGARPPRPRNGPDTTPLPYPNRQNLGKRRSVWGRALELALQVGPQLRKPTIGKPPPRSQRNG